MLLAGLLLAGCSEDPTAPLASLIEPVAGADQLGPQGSALPEPVIIRVLDGSGDPMPDVAVEWRVIEGGGSVAPVDARTDAAGEARAHWSLGFDAGQNLLLVSARGATLTVRATSRRWVASVTAGGAHTCALSTLGEAYCWGANGSGQLGDGSETARAEPAAVDGGIRFRTLSAGWSHTCGVTAAGTAYCWGDNREGQLGIGATPRAHAPVRVDAPQPFSRISAGFIHTCALTEAGAAYCWGGNAQRQLGTGDGQGADTPRPVAGATPLRHISTGEFHTCAVGTDGRGYCWGWNSLGEVGTGAARGSLVDTPTELAGGLSIDRVAAGVRHSCATDTDGALHCWGRNGSGEVGTPPFHHQDTPYPLFASGVFGRVGAGNVHSCAAGADPGAAQPAARAIFCWGADGFNDLGPTPAPILTEAEDALAVGVAHTCGIRAGSVWCWGTNAAGQLGIAGVAGSAQPVQVRLPGQ
ncbi:MAG: hypothetical protein WEB88_09605 [Gemmatimonadota bacterium]